jgi:transcriptional regulator, abrB family
MLNEKKISKVGSITIPSHIRRQFGISESEKFKIEVVNNGEILLTRINGSCIMCESNDELIEYKGKYICKECLNNINEINNTSDESEA